MTLPGFDHPQSRSPEHPLQNQNTRVTALPSTTQTGNASPITTNSTEESNSARWINVFPSRPSSSSRSPSSTVSRQHPSQHHSPADPSAGLDQVSSGMIGPPSSFYDPDQAATQDTPDYQQWLDSYGQMEYLRGGDGGVSFHQQGPQQQRIMGHLASPTADSALQAPMQNQYHFVSGQYAPSSASSTTVVGHGQHFLPEAHTSRQSNTSQPSHAAGSGRSARQSDYSTLTRAQQQQSGSLHGALGSYPQQQLQQQQPINSELFYFQPPLSSDLLPNDQPQSYNFASSGKSTQQPQYHSPNESSHATYTPSSDQLNLPPSHSSVSPSSWTEDTQGQGRSQAYKPGSSNAPVRQGQSGAKRERTAAKSAQKPKARKRARKSDLAVDSETESEDDGFDVADVAPKGPGQQGMPSRLPGACTHCKKLKMKCDFPKNVNICKRCKTGGHPCIVEGRKPRSAPNKREYLLAQIRQKDAIIESLLKQLHNPYLATPLSIASYRMATSPSDQNNRNIIAWLDRLQASVRTAGVSGGANAYKLDNRARGEGNDDDSDAESDRVGLVVEVPDDDDADDDGTADPDKLQNLPDAAVPLGLIANLSLSNSKAKSGSHNGDVASSETLDDDNVGVANETYFMPGPATDLGIRAMLIEQHSPPEILVHGLVAPEDVDKLFDIFYTHVNPFISLLDPVLHTPSSTFARCPFLFTVICAISSRYYAEKSEIYPIAMHFAKHSAANALIDGWKSVELCQAYILMSIYAVPARRWEEDRSWLYTGLAIRIATDLNLHQVTTAKPTSEKQEREILNRTRVWMICFNLDRSTATQFGKPSTIKEDYVMRNSSDWYKKSKYNLKHDVHLCAYSSLLRIVARFHDDIFSDPNSPSGLNKSLDFQAVTQAHDEHLTRYHEEWSKRFAQDSDPNDRGSAFRCTLLPFLVSYSRLVMYSFGFQQAFLRGIQPGDHVFFSRCLDAAKSVITNMVETLATSGNMRYAPDGHFVFAAFASAFLLKLLRPEFSQTFYTKDLESEIFELIGRLIQTLSSPDIAIDDRHTPKLYARFLAGLLSRHRRDGGATSGRLHPQPPPQTQVARTSSTNTTDFSLSQTTFSALGGSGSSGGHPQTGTPVYRPEATYALGGAPIDLGGDVGFTMGSGGGPGGFSDEEMLATMQALKNPSWWNSMMMPGFSWPDNQTMLTPPADPPMPPPPYSQNHDISGLHPHYGLSAGGLGGLGAMMGMNWKSSEVPLSSV